eukprot:TRINITY_DN7772_c0_g1_i1.p1 TRINITY_DN7772_c0_g1~~TRINITY_DN7772_c0_g1_i1.p1  ORF type:complete len:461 (-),score=105.59 TRINITY_DN7772_c0_g1_i1:177-1535(-)
MMLSPRAALLLLCGVLFARAAVVNKDVKREIDLTTNVARHTINLELAATPTDKHFYLVLPASNATHLAKLQVVRGAKGKHEVPATRLDAPPAEFSKHSDLVFWQVPLPKKNPESVSLTVKLAFADAVLPFPPVLSSQNEQHLVRFFDSIHFLSPYPTDRVVTTVRLASRSVESYTLGSEVSPVGIKGDILTYGPYTSVPAFSTQPLAVHFRHSERFLKATQARRVFQVSHWGMLQVEEEYTLLNAAAKYEGSFSRLDYEHVKPACSVEEITAVVPLGSSDIYFRDTIGNISTSRIRSTTKKSTIEVDLQQRYPLLGGWQSNFYWGFNLPLEQVLQINDSRYHLTLPFAAYAKNLLVDDLEIEVRLPEGSSNIDVAVGGRKAEWTLRKVHSNLDLFGKPTVVINAKNIVTPDHDEKLEVSYDFVSSGVLFEPLLLSTGFFALMIGTLLVARLP